MATSKESGKILFFQYSGDLSISSELSNELSYLFPEKIIIIMYNTGVKVNISVREKRVREIVLEAIKDLNEARGGGHEDAVGARIGIDDLNKFKENMINLVEENKI